MAFKWRVILTTYKSWDDTEVKDVKLGNLPIQVMACFYIHPKQPINDYPRYRSSGISHVGIGVHPTVSWNKEVWWVLGGTPNWEFWSEYTVRPMDPSWAINNPSNHKLPTISVLLRDFPSFCRLGSRYIQLPLQIPLNNHQVGPLPNITWVK